MRPTMYSDLLDYVASELAELETRDVDRLFECLMDNLSELGAVYSTAELYAEIERQVEAERRADAAAGGAE